MSMLIISIANRICLPRVNLRQMLTIKYTERLGRHLTSPVCCCDSPLKLLCFPYWEEIVKINLIYALLWSFDKIRGIYTNSGFIEKGIVFASECVKFRPSLPHFMMTSSNGSIFRVLVTGPLWGESSGRRWIPLTKASDSGLWFFLICAWANSWSNNRYAGDLRSHRAHYDVTVMYPGIPPTRSLWPSDAIWRQRSGSTLAQVMSCCLTAPSHYLNQCWLIYQWGPKTFTWKKFHERCPNHQSLKLTWKLN